MIVDGKIVQRKFIVSLFSSKYRLVQESLNFRYPTPEMKEKETSNAS